MAYDLPMNFTNRFNETVGVDGIGSLFEYGAYATGGWFGSGILFLIFIISFGASALMNVGRAFASASFITFIFSIYFARIGLITPVLPIILITCVIAGFFWAKSERANY